jgi:hypothetical protein
MSCCVAHLLTMSTQRSNLCAALLALTDQQLKQIDIVVLHVAIAHEFRALQSQLSIWPGHRVARWRAFDWVASFLRISDTNAELLSQEFGRTHVPRPGDLRHQ